MKDDNNKPELEAVRTSLYSTVRQQYIDSNPKNATMILHMLVGQMLHYLKCWTEAS